MVGQEVRGPDELDAGAARTDHDRFARRQAHAPTEEDDRGREVSHVGVEQTEEPRYAREPRDLVEGGAARVRVVAEVVRAKGRDHFHDRGVAPVNVQEDDAHAEIQSLGWGRTLPAALGLEVEKMKITIGHPFDPWHETHPYEVPCRSLDKTTTVSPHPSPTVCRPRQLQQ